MALAPGTRLGPYALVSQIGAGGMGEVYRARDTRLDRSVAIKVLPAALASDVELRERFEREARTISSLRHPHICTLYDIGEEGSTRFLVLELLEGETLADRLERTGALPVPDAVKIALQICDALDRAHRSGIVHRDLKPGNVFLERSGGSAVASAKLLDFGLAKSTSPVPPAISPALPTTPATLTAQGTILGTFQYMAPEQIEGLEADQRTDIFAFGALLFEMLTGRTAFEGKTRAALLGAILKDDPPSATAFNPAAPKSLDRIIATCLAKAPDDRWQSARDVTHALHLASLETAALAGAAPPHQTSLTRVAWVLVAVLTIALAAALAPWSWRTPARSVPIVFPISPPPEHSFGTPFGGGTGFATQAAMSPDARHIVFVAEGTEGNRLWLRSLDNPEARLIPGTDGAAFPFWSPDGRFVGFFAAAKLMKVNVTGGRPVEVCAALSGRGGTWNRDNTIVFSGDTTAGLRRVSASGGTPVEISKLDTEYGETSHRFPWFLPDGRRFLYTAVVGTCCPPLKPARIKIGSLDTAETETLPLQVESVVAYASGHLLFNRAGALMAQSFDPSTHALQGEAFLVADGVSSEGSRYASFSASETGTLLYARGARPPAQLTWLDRTGRPVRILGKPATYANFAGNLALSPDDRTVAASISDSGRTNIHLIDAASADTRKVTFERSTDASLVWSPDGKRLAFHGVRGDKGVLILLTIGSLREEMLLNWTPGTVNYRPTDWSPDGRHILYVVTPGTGGLGDIEVVSVEDGKRRPYVQTAAHENSATFSPDGTWIAYEVHDTGQPQVFVRRFPATDEKHQVSVDGGVLPRWSPNGKELFFMAMSGDMAMMAVDVDAGLQFRAGPPRRLFPLRNIAVAGVTRQYAVSRDAKHFLAAVPLETQTTPLTVVVNWLSQPK